MLRINRYKSTLTVSLMFCLLSTMSCGFDDGYDNEDQNDDAVRVAFRMSYANGNTRAANEGWDDYDPKDDGTAYENAINTEQLQIKVCDENGTIIGDVENVIAINNGTDTNPEYSITGTWENAADKLSKAKKIMVFFLFVFIVNICLGTIMYMVESYAGNPAFNNIPNGIY